MFLQTKITLIGTHFFRKGGWKCVLHNTRAAIHSTRHTLQQGAKEDAIKFSGTKASDWRAVESLTTKVHERPKYQSISILTSMSVFLLYFCVLREENDLDDYIGTSLYDRVPGLEEKQLIVRIDYDRKQGMDTTELEKRLEDVRGAQGTK